MALIMINREVFFKLKRFFSQCPADNFDLLLADNFIMDFCKIKLFPLRVIINLFAIDSEVCRN